MPKPIIVLDTCVLVPRIVREFLVHVAAAGFYEPCWNAKILGDLKGVLINKMGYAPEQANDIVRELKGIFPWGEVTMRPERMATLMTAEGDQHVLDAAIEGNALAIVTKNIKDFPAEAVSPYAIEVWTPDDLLLFCSEPIANRILGVVQDHAGRENLSGEEFLNRAKSLRQAAPKFVNGALGAFQNYPGRRFNSHRPV